MTIVMHRGQTKLLNFLAVSNRSLELVLLMVCMQIFFLSVICLIGTGYKKKAFLPAEDMNF